MLDRIFGSNFKGTIQDLAEQNNWTIDELSNDRASLTFETKSGDTQQIEIFKGDDGKTLEFTASLPAGFDDEDDMPHELSTYLLRRNWDLEHGYWCIDESDGQFFYTVAYDEDIDQLDGDYFAEIIAALVEECDQVASELD